MFLLDENNRDIARKYRINFDGQNKTYATETLTRLLKNPIIMSKETKEGIATDLLEESIFLHEDIKDLCHCNVVESNTQNIRQISEYVRIADVETLRKRFDFPFTIGFIAVHLSDFDNFTKELDGVSSYYVNLLLKYFGYDFDDLRLLLSCYYQTKSLKQMSEIINCPEQVSSIPEIKLFKQVFSHVTLTEENTWLAPFSIHNAIATSCYYEESERCIIEASVDEALYTDLAVKKLSLKPFNKK